MALRDGLLGALWRTLQCEGRWLGSWVPREHRPHARLPRARSCLRNQKLSFQIHKCDMQRLLDLSVDFCQQTQCQDCIQYGTTMGKSRLVRPMMLLKQGVKSGEENMCKYFAWDWQKDDWSVTATLKPWSFSLVQWQHNTFLPLCRHLP